MALGGEIGRLFRVCSRLAHVGQGPNITGMNGAMDEVTLAQAVRDGASNEEVTS